ncbi:hypothetical protein DEU56DRAFT_422192 [Suillus clintonianus]|uniref:uncharacterized protein n=1 Tax=Suillus clintonianus TaxID=1904413 RepID=UPI001B86EC1E|nr:uncharacterized protein DEU56DRAFT_422192 [Suillus clintonianus]KAG2132958.1 hypothetical protein DEU56DRAFT_422192 [Suillus clintonianus]
MSTETITKRLHISGLTTPAITPADLAKRLGAFGRVISLDGFGKLDALGQLRPFGYATIEGHKTDLARCVNVLSGTVWKGAKLRIGDAKPDFRERLASIPSPPPKKRRANSKVGTHAPDMSLITPETALTRGGWRVTEMGRVVRVMRMRPEKALEPPRALASAGTKKRDKDGKLGTGRRKKRVKLPATRARRRTIDPTRWDSTHLKGIWLDAEVAGAMDVVDHANGSVIPRKRHAEEAKSSDNEQDTESAHSTEDEGDDHESPPPPVPKSIVSPLPLPVLSSFPTARPPITEAATGEIPSLAQEKLTSLAFLHSLFDKDGDEGWGGQETLSDVEDARLEGKGKARETETRMDVGGGDIEIEEVPQAKYEDTEMGSDTAMSPIKSQSRPTSTSEPSAQNQKQTMLKDLFAPREEEAGFSLLGHLDLDFEEEDILGISDLPHLTQPDHALALPHAVSIPREQPQVHPTLDPNFPFFFPLPSTLRSRSSNTRNTPQDIFSLFPCGKQDRSGEPFSRTQNTSEIHSQWEAQKGALTREWKARWREASKGKRGRDE